MQPGEYRWRIPALLALVIVLAIGTRFCDSLLNLSADPETRPVLSLAWVAAMLTVVFAAVRFLLWPVEWNTSELKRLLLGGIFVSAALVIFLLPPFQGPDETAHWKNALWFYRVDKTSEPVVYNLNEIIDTGPVFYLHQKYDPEKLRTSPIDGYRSNQPPPDYVYVHYHSYPVVALLSLVFPRIETLRDALTFFYVCRGMALLFLLVVLYCFHKRYEAPYTLLVFFTLPLVMQQSIVVTADTFLNLGTLCAVMIFLKQRREPNRAWTVVLWALCLAMIYSKPIVAGIVLLPISLLPLRKSPIVIPALLVAVLGAVYVTCVFVIDGMRRSNGHFGIDAVNTQLASLHTLSGLRHLLANFVKIVAQCCDPRRWAGPLGWLDTDLNPVHESLILISFLIALLADAVAYFPRMKAAWNIRRSDVRQCLLLIAAIVFVNIFCETLIYYVIGVPPGSAHIFAWQMRHMFPCFMAAMLLPAMLTPVVQTETAAPAAPRIASAFDYGVIVILIVLLIFRDAELSMDLLFRYW
jgi:hypothetical protein